MNKRARNQDTWETVNIIPNPQSQSIYLQPMNDMTMVLAYIIVSTESWVIYNIPMYVETSLQFLWPSSSAF